MIAQTWLVAALCWASGYVWVKLIARMRDKRPLLDWNDEPRCRWVTAWELVGVYVALVWILIHLIPAFFRSARESEDGVKIESILLNTVVALGVAVVLPCVIAAGTRSFAAIGYSITKLVDQVRVGIGGYFAAVLPMAISMALTLPIRTIDRQHTLLKLLSDSPDVWTLTLITVTAVICAPLLEELIFRVVLQSWLAVMIQPAWAIITVAIAFSLVHGWRDGLALLPLSLILGYVFYRRHSYLSVVVIHSLFNATMLCVQLLNPRISQ